MKVAIILLLVGCSVARRVNPYTGAYRNVSPIRGGISHPHSSRLVEAVGYSLGGVTQCSNQLVVACQDSKYRTYDGSCNNLRNPTLGMINTPYSRLLPARYADGIHHPPTSVSGLNLPSARLLSTAFFPDVNLPDPDFTLNLMQWGQLINHDTSLSLGTSQARPNPNLCCSRDGSYQLPQDQAPPRCFSIPVPQDDPLYSRFGQGCLNFIRSITDVQSGCATANKPHDQIVTVSHFIDGSVIYGSNQHVADSLRAGVGGQLRVEVRRGLQWPPSVADKNATCDIRDYNEPCYLFGDSRGNQNSQLTVLHIILVREHNRIASTLQQLNPHWDDETLYQETRRILVAKMQHITYAEWLPIFVGVGNALQYGLLHQNDGYVNDYREDVDPSILNGHATGAFRYFHTAIQGQIQLINEYRTIIGAFRLSEYMNRPGIIEQGTNMDDLTRGLSTWNQEVVDNYYTAEVTDFLFRSRGPIGGDLRSFDIQRSRDHGIPSYNDFRAYCGLPRASNWADFGDFISHENVERMSRLYAHPDDVDLVVGGSLETHINGTLAGPTNLCIMLEQFYRSRVGDRYFYENGNQLHSFTPEQLRQIRQSTLSRIMCDNADAVQGMQPQAFRMIGKNNVVVPCNDFISIPVVDLSAWREDPLHIYGK